MTPASTDAATAKRPAKPGPWRVSSILDGRQLRIQLTAAALDNLHDEAAARARAMDLLHGALFRGRMIAQDRLNDGADGLDTARLMASVQDEVLSALFDFTTTHVIRSRNLTEGERLAVFATGGYGRSVLAPSSDIDLLFLRPYKQTPWAESVIEYMLYMLWDMGLKVGHAFRTLDECIRLARQDVTIKTSLLDARFLFGDRELADGLIRKFQKEIVSGGAPDFIRDKLAERDDRHTRHGDSRYVVEPHIKDGKGGLRDLQTLFWLVKFTYGGDTLEDILATDVFTRQEARVLRRAARFLWTVRCHLHFLTGRPEERLGFDLQPEMAARFGYVDDARRLGVEKFMKRYFLEAKNVGSLTRILCAKLEAEQQKEPLGLRRLFPAATPKLIEGSNFVEVNGRLSIPSDDHFRSNVADLVRLFETADRLSLDIHPVAMSAASRSLGVLDAHHRSDPALVEPFLALLTNGKQQGQSLRLMNEAGVLGRLVPEFGGIVGQTQFNMYHHFTVDEHTLRAIDVLASIDQGQERDRHPLSHDLIGRVEWKRALYLALLLHDTGKGKGDQQVQGAKSARRACLRLGLDKAEAELVSWLVGNHLEMSETAQKRDISDPRTVKRFAEKVGSIERLRLLLILTVADIRAVGPGVWNGWKGSLLRELYHATAAALRGGRTDERSITLGLEAEADARRQATRDRLGTLPPLMEELEAAYWTGFQDDAYDWHASALQTAIDQVVVDTRQDAETGSIELLVSGQDRPGLFADLAGAVAAQGANIASAHIFTAQSGFVVDVFILQDEEGQPFADGERSRLSRVEAAVLGAVMSEAGEFVITKPRPNRRKAAFLIEPLASFDNDLSAQHTVVEVSGRDRPALLHDVARLLSEYGLSIHSAHIGSYGERVFDSFYVQTNSGQKLTDRAIMGALKAQLLNVLSSDEPDAPKTPVKTLSQSKPADSF